MVWLNDPCCLACKDGIEKRLSPSPGARFAMPAPLRRASSGYSGGVHSFLCRQRSTHVGKILRRSVVGLRSRILCSVGRQFCGNAVNSRVAL